MKTLLLAVSLGFAVSTTFTSCRTAEGVADDTVHVVEKAGHVTGHAVRKTGSAVAHGGAKLERATSDR